MSSWCIIWDSSHSTPEEISKDGKPHFSLDSNSGPYDLLYDTEEKTDIEKTGSSSKVEVDKKTPKARVSRHLPIHATIRI